MNHSLFDKDLSDTVHPLIVATGSSSFLSESNIKKICITENNITLRSQFSSIAIEHFAETKLLSSKIDSIFYDKNGEIFAHNSLIQATSTNF